MQPFLNKTPFARFLLPFAAGITISILFDLNREVHWQLLLSYFVLLVLYLLLFKTGKTKFIFGLTLHFFLFVLGVESCYLRKETNNTGHYSYSIQNKDQRYIGYISEIPQLKEKSIKCKIEILKQEVNDTFQNANGELLVYIEKTDSISRINYGDKIVFVGQPQLIAEAKNPYEFNYKKYLSFKNIFHQVYLKKSDYVIDGKHQSNALIDFSTNLKIDLLQTLKENGLAGNEYAITAALMLGYDDEISGDLMTAYSHTGTLHVLSVSGLHVGVLFIALTFLLRFPNKRKWIILKTIIILSSLWFYALLSGLSPSVVRSTAMFSFVLFGTIINKKGQIYNSIFASAFLMLLFDPFLLLDTGFQLSYLAVAGIVFFYPYIYNWYLPRNLIDTTLWKMFAVSLSAQIITLPITLYYFHQFPVLFFIANLLVIPLSYVVMFGSVLIVIFSKIKVVASVLTFIVAKSVWIMNSFTEWLDKVEFSYISGINTGFIDMLLLFLLLGTITYALLHKNYISFVASFLIMIFMLGSSIFFSLSGSDKNQLLVFHFNKESEIGLISHRSANYFIGTDNQDNNRSKQTISNFNSSSSINQTKENHLPEGVYLFNFAGKKWCWTIGGDLSKYELNKLNCDYLIISKDARIKKIEDISTLKIIADGSNNYKTLNFLKKKFENTPQKLWITKEKGAFIYE